MTIEELKEEISSNFGTSCIAPHCDNTGAYPVEPDGDAEQCEFCHTFPASKYRLNFLIDKAVELGKAEGYNDGFCDGYNKGHSEGADIGHSNERYRIVGVIDKEISDWICMAQNLEYIGEPDDIELANEYRENATLISGLKNKIGGSNA